MYLADTRYDSPILWCRWRLSMAHEITGGSGMTGSVARGRLGSRCPEGNVSASCHQRWGWAGAAEMEVEDGKMCWPQRRVVRPCPGSNSVRAIRSRLGRTALPSRRIWGGKCRAWGFAFAWKDGRRVDVRRESNLELTKTGARKRPRQSWKTCWSGRWVGLEVGRCRGRCLLPWHPGCDWDLRMSWRRMLDRGCLPPKFFKG